MKKILLAAFAVALALATYAIVRGGTPGEQGRTSIQLKEAIDDEELQFAKLVPDSVTWSDPDQRQAVAARAVPALKKLVADISELFVVQPAAKEDYLWDQSDYLAYLALLGDTDAPGQLEKMSTSADADESEDGVRGRLLVQWYLAGKNIAKQTQVVDQLGKLDAAHPDSRVFTVATLNFRRSAATGELKDRLLKLALGMTSAAAGELRQSLEDDQRIQSLNENKPLVIAGSTVDGKPFTTADWKGHVVLVDFWATWCGPCVAEMPSVKKIYADYHGKGLEIVGVSNDYNPRALKDFIAKNDMPWPQIFDPAAGEQEKWNPITLDHGINGIPTMFLIDKSGVCRSVSAMDDAETLLPKLLAE